MSKLHYAYPRTWTCPIGIVQIHRTPAVVKKVGSITYLLNNGQKWNASKLSYFQQGVLTCPSNGNETVLDGLTVPENMHYCYYILNQKGFHSLAIINKCIWYWEMRYRKCKLLNRSSFLIPSHLTFVIITESYFIQNELLSWTKEEVIPSRKGELLCWKKENDIGRYRIWWVDVQAVAVWTHEEEW